MVSILIPAYNAENWVAQTIRSALAQTWRRKEIIIVDDGSRDRTLAVAQQFASRAVSVIGQPNQGAAAARNRALAECQGDYIQWLDADDILAPDKIARQIEASKQCSTDRTVLSSAWGKFVYRVRKARFHPSSIWTDLSPVEWLLRKLGEGAFMQTAAWLVSRELTQAAGPWDTRLLGDDDGEYFCRVLLASDGTRFVPEARTYYRNTGAGSLSYTGRSLRKLEAQFLACELQVQYLLRLEQSERSRAACLKFLQRHLFEFYGATPELVKKTEQLAATLGGHLETPQFSWKYHWIAKLLGWTWARRGQLRFNQLKWGLIRCWDKALEELENRCCLRPE